MLHTTEKAQHIAFNPSKLVLGFTNKRQIKRAHQSNPIIQEDSQLKIYVKN